MKKLYALSFLVLFLGFTAQAMEKKDLMEVEPTTQAPAQVPAQTIKVTTPDGSIDISKLTIQYIPYFAAMLRWNPNQNQIFLDSPVTLESLTLIVNILQEMYNNAPILKLDPQFFTKYSPADIPAQAKNIVENQFNVLNLPWVGWIVNYPAQKWAERSGTYQQRIVNLMNTADYLGLVWIINAASRIWLEKGYTLQDAQTQATVTDVIEYYLQKYYEKYSQEGPKYSEHVLLQVVTNEYSIADLIAFNMLPLHATNPPLNKLKIGGIWFSIKRPGSLTSVAGINLIPEHIRQNIEYLDLSDNYIASLPSHAFAGLPNLVQLNLSRNNISSIEPGAFAGLPNLVQLNLSRNNISSIEPGAFTGLPKVKRINLGHNNISKIDYTIFRNLPNLKELDLRDNPLSEQDIARLRAWLATVMI